MSNERDVEEFLAHFGVKGMKWGVRKEPVSNASLVVRNEGVRMGRDGSIEISKGASLQRLVRSNGKSLPMKDITYASINAYDNAKYIKEIGGNGPFGLQKLLGGTRDQILAIQATEKITAPSLQEATAMVSKRILNDETFRAKNTNMLGFPITDKELEAIRKDPLGRDAQAWYEMTNQKLTFDPEFDVDAPYVQKALKDDVMAKGYNALRDENDVGGGISKSPIIIFEPQNSLKVVTVTQITDELRKANKQQLKAYHSRGKEWLDQELYGN